MNQLGHEKERAERWKAAAMSTWKSELKKANDLADFYLKRSERKENDANKLLSESAKDRRKSFEYEDEAERIQKKIRNGELGLLDQEYEEK